MKLYTKNYENPSVSVIVTAKKISGTFLCGHGVDHFVRKGRMCHSNRRVTHLHTCVLVAVLASIVILTILATRNLDIANRYHITVLPVEYNNYFVVCYDFFVAIVVLEVIRYLGHVKKCNVM